MKTKGSVVDKINKVDKVDKVDNKAGLLLQKQK